MAIHEGYDKLNTIKKLEDPWEGKTGIEVEDFICRRLDSAVSSFDFDQPNSALVGYNAEGKEISRTTVINSTPTYVPKIEIVNLRINSNNNDIKTGENINLNQPSIVKFEVGIRFTVEYEVLGKFYYSTTPQSVKFNLGNQSIIKNRVIPNSQANLDAIQYVDITDLFKVGISNGTLSASCAIEDQEVSSSYSGKLNIKKITLSYTNKGYVEGKVASFNVSGLTSSEVSEYRLVYFDGNTGKTEVDLEFNNRVDTPELSDGAHQLYARIEYKANAEQFYSNWIQTNLIINCNNIQGSAVAVINSVPTEINNCSNALLYKICYAPGTNGGDITINSYVSEDYDDFENLQKLTPFNSTTLTLMSGDKAGEREFYSYFELETVSDTDARFIGFTINDEIVYSYTGDGSSVAKYFTINIVENPYNIDNAFNHVPGAILDFSQINGSGSNVFKDDSINLQPGDGWGIDGKYTTFSVSAGNQALYKTPMDFSSYLNNGFTFEFLLRTCNVNGDDYVLRIGNLLVGPGYVRVYEDPDENGEYALDGVFINSKADFQKDSITHILITYEKEYLPKTYMDTYNRLLNNGSANYQTSSDVTPYNVLKIYINGVINREIQLSESQLRQNGTDFKFQIFPTSSDVKFYGVRTYNYPFTYNEIQKNRISALLDADEKKAYYDKNDILDENGKISLRKCFNKYNVLVYAIPTDKAPLYYGNKGTEGDGGSATVLIHYADPDLADYNGRMWGGKYKAQGSSAKKYLIHNCQYDIKKGKFLTEAEIAHNAELEPDSEEIIKPRNYYAMPGTKINAKKFVGKVNYASSMQTHKQGACDTYDGAYQTIFSDKVDTVFPLGGRKTCFEKEFLYFYYNLTPEQTLDTITIQDTLDSAEFVGFQTWGSGKADDPTYGYDEDKTPEYMLMEGADNGNAGANFKVPWAAFQTYNSDLDSLTDLTQQTMRVTKNASIEEGRYTKGLLISDETIKYGSDNDPLDVDYGAEEGPAFKKKTNEVYVFKEAVALNSLPYFVEFYNAVYQYDFTCLVSSGSLGIDDVFDTSKSYDATTSKIYISKNTIPVTNSKDPSDSSITSASRFDVFRWDAIRNKWVPAGLHHKDEAGSTWETFNLVKEYNNYSNTDLYKKYEGNPDLINTSNFGKTVNNDITFNQYLLPAMRNMFMCACEEYVDVDDIAFHQAMIRTLSGTDNRAKNTYFQIIGKIYEDGVKTDRGDYKVRLMQDDLDTIFATDNNGQQNKPYYLLEPAFNKDTENKWGDNHSSFFYPFDLCYVSKINLYTGYIINYLLGSGGVETAGTNLYNHFLHIQKYFPAIAYNHTAEIFYELAQTVYQEGSKMYENGDFKDILNDYVNNSVKNPLSLSHGSSYEGEVQFLKDRLLLLATLTKQGSGLQTSNQTMVNKGTGGGDVAITVTGNAKYINYFYPNYTTSKNYNLLLNKANTRDTLNYDSLLDITYLFPSSYDRSIIGSISVPNTLYPIELNGTVLTGTSLSNSDQYKYIEITSGLEYLGSLVSFPNAAYVIIDGVKTKYSINLSEIKIYDFLPVIEELKLTNVSFNNTVLDFRSCNRLRKVDLSGCSKIESVIFPEGGSLTEVILPSCIKSVSILNNPNLREISFENGTKITSLSINCDGISSEFDVTSLIRTYFDFSNAQLLKLTGGRDLDLDIVTLISTLGLKANLLGTYTILDENKEPANISYQLKKDLVTSFGDIDSKNNDTYFIYTPSPLNETSAVYEEVIYGCRYVEGSDNTYYPFEGIYFTKGNDVVISDGILDITYSLNSKAPADIDSVTGEVKVRGNSITDYDYTVVVRSKENGPITIKGKIYFGYREPEIGDYAYADGTFSKTLIKNKTLVGMTFAKKVNGSDTSKLDLLVLGTDTVNGICGPDYYTHNNGMFNVDKTNGVNQSKVYNLLTTLFYPEMAKENPPLEGAGNSYGPYMAAEPMSTPVETITSDTSTDIYPTRLGKTNTYHYKTVADQHLKTLAENDTKDFFVFMNKTNSYMTGGYAVKDLTMEDFSNVCDYFNTRLSTYVPSGSGAQGSLTNGSYAQLLYPAFYQACLYTPVVKAGESLHVGYSKGNWYVPSVDEIRILVANRIKSTTLANNAAQSAVDWASKAYTGFGMFTDANKGKFTGFLDSLGGTTYSYMTSDVCNAQGGNIIYGASSNYGSSIEYKWFGSYSWDSAQYDWANGRYDHINCRRDFAYTMPLCCEITISKE
jgi:hypothetical protein